MTHLTPWGIPAEWGMREAEPVEVTEPREPGVANGEGMGMPGVLMAELIAGGRIPEPYPLGVCGWDCG